MSGQQMDGGNDRGADTPPSFDRRYREMLGAGLDLLDQGVTVFDEELRMVAWNTTFLRLLDFPESLAKPGVNFEDFIRYNAERGDYGPGDPAAQVAERVARARSFQPHVTERVRPNGQILSIRGFPLPHQGFITVYTDITGQRHSQEQIARHQAEIEEHIRLRTDALTRANAELTAAIESNKAITGALRRSEQRLREITDAIPAAVAYFDHDWTYRYANIRLDVASGNWQLAVVRLSGVGLVDYTRVMDTGVVAAPTAGDKHVDLGATYLPAGEYALAVWADNTTLQTRYASNSGVSSTRASAETSGLASGVPASGTVAWASTRFIGGLTIEADV